MTTIDPEEDGIIRAAPLFVEYNGFVYPSLALQVVLNQFGASVRDVEFEEKILRIPTSDGETIKVPVDARKRLNLNFRFGWEDVEEGFDVVNYWKLIDGLDWLAHEEELLKTDRSRVTIPDLNDKILIIGSSASATFDIKATPISQKYPGMGTIGTIIRSGRIIIPNGDELILAGDDVIVFALPQAVTSVEKLFD